MKTASKQSEKIIGNTSNYVAMEYKMKNDLDNRIKNLRSKNQLSIGIGKK